MSKFKIGDVVSVFGDAYKNYPGDENHKVTPVNLKNGLVEEIETVSGVTYYAYIHDLEGNIFWAAEEFVRASKSKP